MAELAPAQVYAPKRTIQVWRTVLNWLAFVFQVVLQITPSLAQLLSFIGLRQPFLSSSSTSSSASFKPLPVQLPVPDSPPARISTDGDDLIHNKLTAVRQAKDSVVSRCVESNDVTTRLEIQRETNGKFEVVLDLDETLVCAYETSSLPSVIRNQAIEAGLQWFELECISGDKEGEGKQKVNHVTVFERPGLHEFLKEISQFADLVLFTAGLEGYACPLVDKIDLENRFGLRLYRPSTISTKYREHVKDLSCITKDLCRTIIVDNNPFSFLLQPVNGIPCVPFSAGQPYDEQLLEVILPLLKQLSLQKDVRPVLYEKFRMPEWFQKQGIPTSDWTL